MTFFTGWPLDELLHVLVGERDRFDRLAVGSLGTRTSPRSLPFTCTHELDLVLHRAQPAPCSGQAASRMSSPKPARATDGA